MARRIILCDGVDLARLWGHIGAAEDEVLTWVPREDAPRARPPGFHSLQGGLTSDAILKLMASQMRLLPTWPRHWRR